MTFIAEHVVSGSSLIRHVLFSISEMKTSQIKKFAFANFPRAYVCHGSIFLELSCGFAFAICFEPATGTKGFSYITASVQNFLTPEYDINFTLGERCRKPSNSQIWTDAEVVARQFCATPQFELYSNLTDEIRVFRFIKQSHEAGRSDLRFLETAYYAAVYFGDLGWAAEVSNHLERLMRELPEQPWHAPLLTEVHAIRTLIHQSGPAATRMLLIRRALENRQRMGLPYNPCDADLKP
jgi:hypothetical protein